MAAPINPKTQPEAPRLIVSNGNKINENMFPISPEIKYNSKYDIFVKYVSKNAPNNSKPNIFEKMCSISPCRNMAVIRRHNS